MTDFPIEDARNLLAGAGTRTVTVEPLEGEIRLHESIGNWRNITGGILVLTNRRLLFAPWNVAELVSVLSWAIPKLGGPDIAAELVRAAGTAIGGVRVAGSVVSARAGKGAGWLHPPTFLALHADGTESEFGVLSSKLSPNKSAGNVSARDEFVAKINGTR